MNDQALFDRLAELLAPLHQDELTGRPIRDPTRMAQAAELMHSLPPRIWLGRLRTIPLDELVLPGIELGGAWLSRVRLCGCVLRGARLTQADLREANLANADLSGADLRGVWAHRVNLGQVRLIDADLSGADLRHADLRGAQLTGANLTGTLLADAICDDPLPVWHIGDSRDIRQHAAGVEADFVFSCPPYADLEVYSDDERDISTLDYADFRAGSKTR